MVASGQVGGTAKWRSDFQVVVRDVIVDRRRLRWVWSGGQAMGKESGVAKGMGDVSRVGGGGRRCRTREGKL